MDTTPAATGAASQCATTAGGLQYDAAGSGDTTLAFLPGWCGPRTLFRPLTSRLSDRYRTVAIDWRGHGGSAPAAGDFGLAELVEDAIAALDPPPPTLHLYAQPADPAFLDAQRGFGASHPWFSAERLDAASHFPMFEVPDAIAQRIRAFVAPLRTG